MKDFFYCKATEDPYYRVVAPEVPHMLRGESDEDTFYGMMIKYKVREEYPHIYESIMDEDQKHCDYLQLRREDRWIIKGNYFKRLRSFLKNGDMVQNNWKNYETPVI